MGIPAQKPFRWETLGRNASLNNVDESFMTAGAWRGARRMRPRAEHSPGLQCAQARRFLVLMAGHANEQLVQDLQCLEDVGTLVEHHAFGAG